MSGPDDSERRNYSRLPFTSKNPIPTIQQYKQNKEEEKARLDAEDASINDQQAPSRTQRAINHAEAWYHGKENAPNAPNATGDAEQLKQSVHENPASADAASVEPTLQESGQPEDKRDVEASSSTQKTHDTTQSQGAHKKRHHDRDEREVTDPVTHLPIKIRDFTDQDLKKSQENDAGPTSPRTNKKATLSLTTQKALRDAQTSGQEAHEELVQAYPLPAYIGARPEIGRLLFKLMVASSLCIVTIVSWTYYLISWLEISRQVSNNAYYFMIISLAWLTDIAFAGFILWCVAQWFQNRTKELWDGEVSYVQKKSIDQQLNQQPSESVLWFNKLIGSIWPLVNPDLFISLADMLEDVMQASLPKFIRMVSVEDIGQGSEAVRILGVKWIPKGAAKDKVENDGSLGPQSSQSTGDEAPGYHKDKDQHPPKRDSHTKQEGNEDTQESDEETSGSGMEAEQGEFVNMEIAFAYHASRQLKKFRDRAKNFHMLLAFYLPGHLKIPVWLELRGFVGTVRLRLQLTSDPPFVSLCTMTFLGQPKVTISCIPLIKKGPNIMDLPFVSNFVQSCIDAATAQSVAPKCNIFDLQAMLSGDGIKKDTASRGIIFLRIHRAFDFKPGDTGIPVVRNSSSDPYVSVGWAKFGKPEFSTRVIINEMHPYWEEQTALLVGPEEIAADESLRVQLWDSDRFTADDDLGRIELSLKRLMRSEKTDGKMQERVDSFKDLKAGETMPGKLSWSVGYFSKTRLQDSQVKKQYHNGNINTVDDLRNEVFRQAGRKLRDAATDETAEIEQLKEQDFENTQAEVISDSPPLEDYPSGILSIQIHQILGLQLEDISGHANRNADGNASERENTDLPSSYCTIALNDQRIYKTRVKPQNAAPFFNAGTERFIRDWRTASLFIAARDSRVHEDDALLGFVHLPLAEAFRSRKASRLDGQFPLAGGIGYGRVKISLVFRSVQMQAPLKDLGWDWGTLRIQPEVTASSDLPKSLLHHRIKFRTSLGRVKMHSASHNGTEVHDSNNDVGAKWTSKHDQPLMLPVRRRYAANMAIEFRTHSSILKDKTPAWGILWLKDIPDEEDMTLRIPVFKGDLDRAKVNVLPESERGEKLGILNVRLRFMRGLSKWHRRVARHDMDVANVMETLASARDNGELEGGTSEGVANDADSDDSSQSEHGDDDHQHKRHSSSHHSLWHRTSSMKHERDDEHGADDPGGANSGDENHTNDDQKGGLVNDLKSYKRHSDQLHRTHRGIMQWKAPRTLKWMQHKAENAVEDLGGLGRHKERQPGVETEV